MDRLFLRLWLLCGTLDALYATALAAVRGGSLTGVWLGVASGPFGDGAQAWGAAGVLIGVTVHFAIMAAMVAAGLWLARHTVVGEVAPWKAGTLYGLVLYTVMYGLILPQRFGLPFPDPDRIKLALAMFPHIAFVGLPIFYTVRRTQQPS